MNNFLKLTSVLAVAGLLAGCNAHGGGFTNSQGGTVIGGLTGAVVGNQFGKGRGNVAATALGAVIGAISGNAVGESMDRPAGQTVIVREAPPPPVYRNEPRRRRPPISDYGPCSSYYDRGERAACLRGVAERERDAQRARERNAYDREVNRCSANRTDRYGRGCTPNR